MFRMTHITHERRVVGSGPRRTGRRSQPRDGRDSGPDQDRYGAHPNADRAPGNAGVTKREQDPLELQGIRVADQERLRSWGPDVGAWRVAVRARAGTAFSTGRSRGPDLWRRRQDPRDPNLGSRDPDRVCVGVFARVREGVCARVSV